MPASILRASFMSLKNFFILYQQKIFIFILYPFSLSASYGACSKNKINGETGLQPGTSCPFSAFV
jgi:hypothetical protein